MNPVTEDIKDLLVDAGLGVFASADPWGVYINLMPESPDECITLRDSPGRAPQKNHSKTGTLYWPGFQVTVRGGNHFTSYLKAMEVHRLLDMHSRFFSDSADSAGTTAYYEGIYALGEPVLLEQDSKRRYVWVSTYHAARKEV